LISIKVRIQRQVSVNLENHAGTVTTEAAILVAAITVAFVGFALTLWWVERQTRDLKG
jgi:hypothetical protein